MSRLSMVVALSGALWLAGAITAGASPAALEWAVTPGANPGTVALLPASSQDGRTDLAITAISDTDTSLYGGYALPDSGWGAAAVSAGRRRLARDGDDEVIQYFGYTWGRAVTPKLAAGATLRWENRRWEFADGTSSPSEGGPGLDLGAVFRPDERTWVEAAVRDAFDTSLEVAGVDVTVLPTSLELGVGRQLTPVLSLGVKAYDLLDVTSDGLRWEAAARLVRGRFAWQAGLSSGADLGVWAGLSAERGAYRADARLESAGGHNGGSLGVTVLW